MAYESYMVGTKGSKQGNWPGASPRTSHVKDIPLIRVDYEILAPRDISTGQAKGKRVHKPIKVTLEVGADTAFWLTALTSNELITETNLAFYNKDKDGKDQHLFNIKLTEVHVVSARLFTGEKGEDSGNAAASTAKSASDMATIELFEVGLSFRRIDFEHKVAKTLSVDDWNMDAPT